MSKNKIGFAGGLFLVEALRDNSSITCLHLSNNGIASRELALIKDILDRNTSQRTIQSLSLQHRCWILIHNTNIDIAVLPPSLIHFLDSWLNLYENRHLKSLQFSRIGSASQTRVSPLRLSKQFPISSALRE